MNPKNITEKLQLVFRTLFSDDKLTITDDLSAADLKEWDSLNNIMLFVEIEKSFKIHFRASEIIKLENVGELIKTISTKLSNNAA